MNNLTTPITAPSLSSAQYGQDVSKRFKTIDQNFDKIVESEFLRGKKGDDIKIVEVDLKDSSNEFRSQIESVISEGKQHSPSIDSDGKTINWYDSFSEDAYSKIYLIYQTSEDNGDILISSLPYTFIDARFSKLNVDFDYSDLIDLSCTVYYQNENFVKVQNFPTLYFDDNIKQFCWMINNQKTGLIARGPQGSTGGNGSILLVKFGEKIQNGWTNIDQIYVDDAGDGKPGYMNTKYAIENGKIILEEGYVVVGMYENENKNTFIISPIKQNDSGDWEANIELGTDLSGIVDAENLIHSLKLLPNGLFVPFPKKINDEPVGYHRLIPYIDEDGKDVLIVAPFEKITDSVIDQSTGEYIGLLSNVSLIINYHNLHVFGDVNISADCKINNDCYISENCYVSKDLIVGESSQLNGSLKCISGKDTIISSDDQKILLNSNNIILTDGERNIKIDKDEAHILIENDGVNIDILPNQIDFTSNDIKLWLGSDRSSNLSLYEVSSIFDNLQKKLEFDNSCAHISTSFFPISGGINSTNIKTWVLGKSVNNNEDYYEKYYKNGIPTFNDLNAVRDQIISITGKDSGSIEYRIINNSDSKKTLLFPDFVRNFNANNITIEDNSILTLIYTMKSGFSFGMESIEIYAFICK